MERKSTATKNTRTSATARKTSTTKNSCCKATSAKASTKNCGSCGTKKQTRSKTSATRKSSVKSCS